MYAWLNRQIFVLACTCAVSLFYYPSVTTSIYLKIVAIVTQGYAPVLMANAVAIVTSDNGDVIEVNLTDTGTGMYMISHTYAFFLLNKRNTTRPIYY